MQSSTNPGLDPTSCLVSLRLWMLGDRIWPLRIVPWLLTALSRRVLLVLGHSARPPGDSRPQWYCSLRRVQWHESRVSSFYLHGGAPPIPGFRTSRRNIDVSLLLKRISIQQAHAELALEDPESSREPYELKRIRWELYVILLFRLVSFDRGYARRRR